MIATTLAPALDAASATVSVSALWPEWLITTSAESGFSSRACSCAVRASRGALTRHPMAVHR
ncbi:hypothetical protein GCM10023191_089420 [Actinoallomurus oryzae]|uniref:Uncharacterized protein n=1 Tax=Actinoallomurus oryzae TaxID=502180 RepID=A0ABP8R3P8_9ACTN